MKTKGLEGFLFSWKFVVCLLLMQFLLMPVATQGFRWEDSSNIIVYTLSHAFFQQMYAYGWVFQLMALLMLLVLVLKRGWWSTRLFMYYGGCANLLYAVIQNVALSEKYGLSIVTVNIVMMSFVGWMWLRAAQKSRKAFAFDNLSWRTAWMIPVALFCLWWPMDMNTALPDADWTLLFAGASGMAFCSMTPVLLVVLLLNKEADAALLRVSAWVGLIIGMYNMANFANALGFYLGIYHLPLLLMSLYALLFGKRIRKEPLCLKN